MVTLDYGGCGWNRISDVLGQREGQTCRFTVVLLYGSWNVRIVSMVNNNDVEKSILPQWVSLVRDAINIKNDNKDEDAFAAETVFSIKVDEDDESLNVCIGELGAPPDLPALLFIGYPNKSESENGQRDLRVEHVLIDASSLESLLTTTNGGDDGDTMASAKEQQLASAVGDAWTRLFDSQGNLLPPRKSTKKLLPVSKSINPSNNYNQPATRIFIAGDRSQVGKSSICLGLLGSLLNSGQYTPTDLAYIKPATQCEQTQLVEQYCKSKGIADCVPIGPIVYYKGFTRAFLKGETSETSEQLLQKASDAVDKLARNKKVVIIDGVGYPAVGSITGTDNASVAKACGRTLFRSSGNDSSMSSRSPVPVVIIGKSGVGDAIDSFNINSTYFAHRNVPVIGAIFNKLSLDGFYSLSNCKEAIDMYFAKSQPGKMSFGYIPEIPALKNAREMVANASAEDQLKQALVTADTFVEEFSKHVNVDRIVVAAKEATAKYMAELSSNTMAAPSSSGLKRSAEENDTTTIAKYPRTDATLPSKSNASMHGSNGFSLTREQIEAIASKAGAAGG